MSNTTALLLQQLNSSSIDEVFCALFDLAGPETVDQLVLDRIRELLSSPDSSIRGMALTKYATAKTDTDDPYLLRYVVAILTNPDSSSDDFRSAYLALLRVCTFTPKWHGLRFVASEPEEAVYDLNFVGAVRDYLENLSAPA